MQGLGEVEGKTWLMVALVSVTVAFVTVWVLSAPPAGSQPVRRRGIYHSLVGFVLCFFDTLGIGNFAPTTAAFKLRGSIPDERIPGTLNVGYTIPTALQAILYIRTVEVEFRTLALMISASVLGAWLGAGVVSSWPRRRIQLGMGFALLGASALLVLSQVGGMPGAGTAAGLSGARLAAGVAGNFVLGALMTLGIGAYAPCLLLVSLLGMNPRGAFPIMMGSCAFLMPVAGMRFLRSGACDRPASLALTIAGIPAVVAAATLVRELSLTQIRWLVLGVVLCTAAMMFRSALQKRNQATALILTPASQADSAPAQSGHSRR